MSVNEFGFNVNPFKVNDVLYLECNFTDGDQVTVKFDVDLDQVYPWAIASAGNNADHISQVEKWCFDQAGTVEYGIVADSESQYPKPHFIFADQDIVTAEMVNGVICMTSQNGNYWHEIIASHAIERNWRQFKIFS